MSFKDLTRREFLKRSSVLGAMGAAAPWGLSLAAMGEAAAQTAPAGDYKALVCIFLEGGNDQSNTIIPCDSAGYTLYSGIRRTLARPLDGLLSLLPDLPLLNAHPLALAPELAPLQQLFDDGALGVLLNVGTLVVPTSKAQFQARSVPLPPKLFSHIDQQGFWQALSSTSGASGWGGRMADLMLAGNGSSAFSSVSVSGNATFLSGQTATQCQVGSAGAVPLGATTWPLYGSQACSDALRTLVTRSSDHVIENAHSVVMRRAMDANALLATAMQAPQVANVSIQASDNTLAAQLQMVARMIAARDLLGVKRQVFHVSLGGFDHHDALASRHPELLAKVAEAMAGFYQATVALGVADQVTSFTASDFGRTLTVNGNGCDHGWGSHHFVMGGSVRGRRFWGRMPELAVNGPDDVGQGRLLPTTSVDQLAAELAIWFGVSGSDLATVLPNSGNFDLGQIGLFA